MLINIVLCVAMVVLCNKTMFKCIFLFNNIDIFYTKCIEPDLQLVGEQYITSLFWKLTNRETRKQNCVLD